MEFLPSNPATTFHPELAGLDELAAKLGLPEGPYGEGHQFYVRGISGTRYSLLGLFNHLIDHITQVSKTASFQPEIL